MHWHNSTISQIKTPKLFFKMSIINTMKSFYWNRKKMKFNLELRTWEREPKALGLCEQIKRVGLDPTMEREREREMCNLGLVKIKESKRRKNPLELNSLTLLLSDLALFVCFFFSFGCFFCVPLNQSQPQ